MARDSIHLTGMRFFAYHGVNQFEKDRGQHFEVDVEMARDLKLPGQTDDLEDTIDYSRVFSTVRAVVEGTKRNLIERVAEDVAQAILRDFDVESVRVTLSKPNAPIEGAEFDTVAVEIVRDRSDIDAAGNS